MKQIAIMGGIAAMLAVFANAENASAAMTRQQAWARRKLSTPRSRERQPMTAIERRK
jgi:hypothetical protein